MSVYAWCTACHSRVVSAKGVTLCANPSSHRAQELVKYMADYKIGGYKGKRKRPLFDTAKDAKDHEADVRTSQRKKKHGLATGTEKMTFGELADRYYADHSLMNTINPEKHTKYRIEFWKSKLGEIPLSVITREQIKDVKRDMQRSGLASATIKRYFNDLVAIFRKGMADEIINWNPAQFVFDLQIEDPVPRFLSQKEIDDLFREIKDPRLLDFAIFLSHTGIRPRYIEELEWSSVDLDNRVIHLTVYKGKKWHPYVVPVDDVLYALLVRRSAITGKRGRVLEWVWNMDHLASEAIERAGLNKGRSEKERFTIYGLKHCYASHLLMSGVSLGTVAELLGHTDMRMVNKHYKKFTLEHLRAAQSKVNLTPKLPSNNSFEFKIVSNDK